MFEILKKEASDEAIRRVIGEEIDGAVVVLTDGDMSKDDAVHEARKSMKRIRAALRLVRDELGEEIFDRENVCYRDAARKLAPLRDSTVMVETLDLVQSDYNGHIKGDSFQTIRQKLERQKEEIRHEFLQQEDVFPNVVATLTEAKERLPELPIDSPGFRAYEEGMKRVYRRGRNRMHEAYEESDNPDIFHDWRKRVKYLWHHTEFLHLLWPALFEPLAVELHQLSDFLGDAHDAAVLIHHLEENRSDYAGDPDFEMLLDLLSKHQKALELAAQPLGYRIYAEKPAVFIDRVAAYWDVWTQTSGKIKEAHLG